MKIVKSLSLILLMAVVLIGCSKDDDGGTSASLVGTWKLTASTTNGVSDIEDCDLKTLAVFTDTTLKTTTYSDTDCMESETSTINYTRSGNTLTFSFQGMEVSTTEITTLNSSTLVVTDTDEYEGETEVYITTFARQ